MVSHNNTRGAKWSVLGHGVQHAVLRFGSLVFAAVSSLSVYQYFSVLIDGPLWRLAIVLLAIGCVIMGYFIMRGWSHRMKEGRSAGSYMLVVLLYLYVEVICNLTYALEHLPAVHVSGVALLFWYMKLSVLSIMPVFGIVLAKVDVDMLREKGATPSVPVALSSQQGAGSRWSQPKGAPATSWPSGQGRSGAPTVNISQGGYSPVAPAQGQGQQAAMNGTRY